MQTLLISALTAAIVTLLIEYAAKPHLEVRKDRIVDSHRTRRELIAKIYLTATNIPPIQGPSVSIVTGKSGIELVEDFLSAASEIRTDFARVSSSLGRRRDSATQRLLSEIRVVEIAAPRILDLYKENASEDGKLTGLLNDELGRLIKRTLTALLGLRSILIAKRSRPWSYYKTIRTALTVDLDPGKPTGDVTGQVMW